MTSLSERSVASPGPAVTTRLRIAAALARCPLAALYRLDGDRAHLYAAHGSPALVSLLADDVPAWRVSRDEIAVVPMVGRGPAAPETAVVPVSFGVAAIVSAPVHCAGERVATLVLADRVTRSDLRELDRIALTSVCDLLGDLLADPLLESSGVHLTQPPRRALEDSLPPHTEELAAWPLQAGGHDPVTGLPDRRFVGESVRVAIDDARRHGSSLAVTLLTLDRFQRIDDWLGRNVSDEVMRQVAERLLDTTGDRDIVARGSGDEFVVMFSDIGPGRAALALGDRVLQAIREPFHVHGYDLSLTATMGMSRFPEDGDDSASLLRYAGIALHRAKVRRRGRLECFTPQLREAVERRGDLERHLRHALGAGELVLHYQPKVELVHRRTTGVEALLRWRRADGLVAPAMFLPVAEESELIVPIGSWALFESCRQMRQWLDEKVPLKSVSVNVSALQFARQDFVETVERALHTNSLPPWHLELEVTETSLMDDVDVAAERLTALRSLGVRVSVDDFGTGYSSLAYLQRLPVDVLKIDRSFVKDLDANGPQRVQAHALAQAITGLGHNLGLRVLAEGVETEAQLEVLAGLGCDEVQGFLFSRPLPAEEIRLLFK